MQTSSISYFKQNQYRIHENCKHPILVAWKLRTPENYGNLLRLADNTACSLVLFVVDENKLSERKIRKTAGDSYQRVHFIFCNEANWRNFIPEEYELIAIETYEFSENLYREALPQSVALVVGNEKRGIEAEILEQCDKVLHIPLAGECKSLNVSHAAAIALFEWLRQYHV